MPLRRQPPIRPLLAYDGDCGFCTYWARYWQKLTSDRVEYRPYQEVAVRYPAISQAEFQRAVQFIALDGHVATAAEASFLTLIPRLTDQNRYAQSRIPMEMIFQG